ncbi:LOW QUALITY PROTEIN: hypothetical protein OSB04_007713 [Centaurea solstitialis]|uniref:Uncharacterized protein n=1 Tax=Centaurea solstitialis TaxID=347529 RepID=A0AA38U4X1_9ASTR|nr:LOW QUALITY PROTEIN: hypothetical protein OSB04_007713 [Centaurea solstitialis]
MDPTEKLHYGVVALKGFLGHIEKTGEELFDGFDTIIDRIEDEGMKKLVTLLKNQLMKKRDAIVEGMKTTMAKISEEVDEILQDFKELTVDDLPAELPPMRDIQRQIDPIPRC